MCSAELDKWFLDAAAGNCENKLKAVQSFKPLPYRPSWAWLYTRAISDIAMGHFSLSFPPLHPESSRLKKNLYRKNWRMIFYHCPAHSRCDTFNSCAAPFAAPLLMRRHKTLHKPFFGIFVINWPTFGSYTFIPKSNWLIASIVLWLISRQIRAFLISDWVQSQRHTFLHVLNSPFLTWYKLHEVQVQNKLESHNHSHNHESLNPVTMRHSIPW